MTNSSEDFSDLHQIEIDLPEETIASLLKMWSRNNLSRTSYSIVAEIEQTSETGTDAIRKAVGDAVLNEVILEAVNADASKFIREYAEAVGITPTVEHTCITREYTGFFDEENPCPACQEIMDVIKKENADRESAEIAAKTAAEAIVEEAEESKEKESE